MAYVSLTEIRAMAQSMTVNAQPSGTDSLVSDLIERASRMFDRECGVEDEYFEAAGAQDAVIAKTFYGNGTTHLRLDPYIASTLNATVTLPDGYSTPYYVERDSYLIRTGADHLLPDSSHFRGFIETWLKGVPVIVTAKWGFASTPAEVKAAVIEWAINIWRETDPSSQKLVNLDGMALREDIPPRVKRIASHWTLKTGEAFV